MAQNEALAAVEALPGSLVSQLKAVFNKDRAADCVVLFWRQTLPILEGRVEGVAVRVVYCESELALREQLVQHTTGTDTRLILLWPMGRDSLGKDVLSRLWDNEPKHIAPWRMLEQLLGVVEIDPRLRGQEYKWLAEQLLSCHERYRRQIRFGHLLDFDRAWQALGLGLLAYDEPSMDLQGLLAWSVQPGAAERVAALVPEVQSCLGGWLAPRLGELSPVVELLLSNGNTDRLVVVGLVCSLLYPVTNLASQELNVTRGRFSERYFGGEYCAGSQLQSFGAAVLACVSISGERQPQVYEKCFAEVEQELARLGVPELSLHSDLLIGGFELRLEAFAAGLSKSLTGLQVAKGVQLAEEALRLLQQHRLASLRQPQLQRAQHAVRLSRWLQSPEIELVGLSALLGGYVTDGGYVDWARSRLWMGDENEQLSAVYQRLLKKVAARRESENAEITSYLPDVGRGAQLAPGDYHVEQALDEWVAPLAAQQPVLLLVLDGMSQAVYRELQVDLLSQRWLELQPEDSSRAGFLLSALPSMTQFSRHSLLSGALSTGSSPSEKKNFEAHAALRKACGGAQYPPVLLHKGELQEPGNGGVAKSVRALIAESRNRVVGAVVNAVDDQLSTNAQLTVPWKISSIALLRSLLECARESGRAVLLCSDHGHVLEQGMQDKSSGGDAERYKLKGAKPLAGEMLVSGARVLSEGGAAVLPFSERLRYANKKMGYHGGASLQELVIPLGVYVSAGDGLEFRGWRDVGSQIPFWWDTVFEPLVAVPALKGSKKPVKTKDRFDSRIDDMFAEENNEREVSENWIQGLLKSPVYAEMKIRAGRVMVSDEQVLCLLELLAERGGQQMLGAVGQVLGIPPIRINGVLAGVQKLLNVDGYSVLSVDRGSKSVRLDMASLKMQFEL